LPMKKPMPYATAMRTSTTLRRSAISRSITKGVILDLNLSGAILLGIKGSQKSRHRFAAFVSPDNLNIFNQFLETVLPATQKTTCEIILSSTPQRPEATVRIEAIPNEAGDECRMVVSDITAERAAQLALSVR
jgi:hypothetical protein